jgi:hypothetical protein
MKPLTPKEALDHFWLIWLAVFKSVAIAVVLAIYFVALVAYQIFLCVFLVAQWLLTLVDDWQPSKPEIFELDEKTHAR